MTTQNHTIIVLASGLSQRLGQAKQLLHKNGEPLIGYMIKLALATQPQAIVVVIPSNNSSIEDVVAKLAAQYAAIHTVMNTAPKTGMAHSLYLGIEALRNDIDCDGLLVSRVLIMGIDQVLLDKSHLIALLTGAQDVVASRYSGLDNWSDEQDLSEKTAFHETTTNKITTCDPLSKDIVGLPLKIDYELLTQWQALLTGDKGLRHLIRGLASHQISSVNNHQLSYDIDTPSQLAHARAQRWIDG
ncbi:NTP transferase domain-containing protein [Psychrobacter sp. FBL11]|uniref:NTP transferase domain-containing protein n=1 Tax=Psychrobacter saeujeotis TaxID=3143436 RepID=A0ABU9X6D1_9GAMM|nr:NTP transferase domain-containing protein [uncultured Psychrobacter sp.]